MAFRGGGGWRNCNHRRRLPGFFLSLELLEGRLVPALDISLSSLTFAEGLLGGELVGTFSVTGGTTAQKFSFDLAQGTGDTDNGRFQIRGNNLEIAPGFPSGSSFTAGASYSFLIQATDTTSQETILKAIQVTAKPNLVVNVSGDVSNPTDGKLSLREALAIANFDPDHDRIVFDAAQVGQSVSLSTIGATIQGPSALLVSTPVSIDGGTGHTLISLESTSLESRLFAVTPTGNLRLDRIDLQGGLVRGSSGNPEGRGGAVLALGPFALFQGSIVGAKAVGLSGAQPGDAKGGAIYAESDLRLYQATVSGNAAEGGVGTGLTGQQVTGRAAGGGIFLASPFGNHDAILDLSTIANNSATFGAGLAILPPSGTSGAVLHLNISGSVLADNKSGSDADIVSGGSPESANITVSQSFAEAIGPSLDAAGFIVGETGLGPIGSTAEQRVHRPLAGSPLIGALSSVFASQDQTGLRRHYPTAAGAAEYYAPPDDIRLDNSAFPASFPQGASIGRLTASGVNAGFSFTFTLVPGAVDNNLFQIQGSELRPAPGSVFAPGTTYLLRVRATGATGLAFEKDISVLAKADIVVDTVADAVDPSDGRTSLREAIIAAAQSPGLDRISVASALAGATIELNSDRNLPGTALFVTSDVQISGELAPGLTLRPQPGQSIRIFQVGFGVGMGLKALTLAGGRAVDGRGGAILATSGKVFLDSVTLVDNSSSGAGAAGGAVATSGGQLAVRNSTFFNNRVEGATGQDPGTGEGGHVFVMAQQYAGGFTGGVTDGAGGGTGSFANGTGGGTGAGAPALTIIGVTFANGMATGGAGGVALFSAQPAAGPSAEINGSAFANSSGADLSFRTITGAQPFSASGGGNFIGSPDSVPTGMTFSTGDARLGNLADNGGGSHTIAPLPGSPLLVPTNPVPGLATDQRGVARAAPFTIGAYQAVLATGSIVPDSSAPVGIGATLDFTVNFSQPVRVIGAPALSLSIAGAKAFAIPSSQPSTSVVFRYAVAQGDVSPGITTGGPVALDFTGGSIVDSAGGKVQLSVPAPASPGPRVDGIAPSGFLGFASPLPSNPSRAGVLNAFAAFGETGLGPLAPDDFNLVNASVDGIIGPDASGKYSFTISPLADGALTVSLKAGALADAAGNPSRPSEPITVISDRTAPAPVLSLNPAPGTASSAPQLDGTVAFGEPVAATISVSDFLATNGDIQSLEGPDATGRFTFKLSPIGDGKVFLSLRSGALVDPAGNPSRASNVVSFVSDRTGPTALIQSAPALISLPGGAKKIGFSLSFADPSGLNASTINSSAVSALGPDEVNFTANYPVVLESFTGGVARFGVPLGTRPLPGIYYLFLSGSVEDTLGNPSQSVGIGTVTIGMADDIPPELLSVTRASPQNPNFGAVQRFVVSFSEPVAGLSPGAFAPVVFDDALAASVMRVTLPNGAPLTAAPVSVVVVEVSSSGKGILGLSISAESVVTDGAGNPLVYPPEIAQGETYEVDTTTLRIVSLGPVESPRETPVETIDIELSKPAASVQQIRDALAMERNGKRFPLDAPFTLSQTGYSSYRIENFAIQSGVAGTYTLRLNAALLADPSGRRGEGSEAVQWVSQSPLQTISYNPVFMVPKPPTPDPFVVGVPKRVLLGTFQDSTGGLMSDYIAHVNWGDGQGSIPFSALENAQVVATATPGVFDIFGTHTYNLDRNYLINVLILDTASTAGSLFGLVESSSVAVTPLQATNLVNERFLRGDTFNPLLTASLQPAGQPRPLLQVQFAQPAAVTGAERTIYLANYATNPQQADVPVAGAMFNWLDLRASGVLPEIGSLLSVFSFTGDAGQQVALFYFNSATGTYEPVLSSGGAAPTVDRDTGLVTVTFDNTSTPKLVNLNETVFAVAVSLASPSTSEGTGPPVASAAALDSSTVNSTLVQASQTLTQLGSARQSASDSGSGSYATGMFVGGRSSTVALTPSALGTGAPARMRASAGGRLALASSRDAAMALGGLLRGAVAPMQRKLKPLMEALGITDQDSPQNSPPAVPMPESPKPPNPERPPGGASSGSVEMPPAGIPAASVRLPENLRVLDQALAAEDDAHAIGPWAMAASAILAAVHLRPSRDRRKDEKDQRTWAPVSE